MNELIKETNEYDVKLEYAKQRGYLLEKYYNLNNLWTGYEKERQNIMSEIKRIDHILGNEFAWDNKL